MSHHHRAITCAVELADCCKNNKIYVYNNVSVLWDATGTRGLFQKTGCCVTHLPVIQSCQLQELSSSSAHQPCVAWRMYGSCVRTRSHDGSTPCHAYVAILPLLRGKRSRQCSSSSRSSSSRCGISWPCAIWNTKHRGSIQRHSTAHYTT